MKGENMKYALDTNTVVRLLREDPNTCKNFDAAVERGDEIAIPPLVHYEIRRGFLCKSAPKREKMYNRLIKQYPVDDVSAGSLEQAARIYAELYSKHFTVEDSDILIAAFCKENDYTLVTDNTKDFENMNGLQFINWAK
jgi:tRNA(fMet)-specific endonuclease VapC